jgi:hypothetical protein
MIQISPSPISEAGRRLATEYLGNIPRNPVLTLKVEQLAELTVG